MAKLQKGYPFFFEYIDFINYCFGMNGTTHAFDKLLPKLYANNKSSGNDTYFALENDKIIGTVLAYPLTFSVAGKTLSARGIGSVATHPRYRGEGFMKKLMKKALDDMVKDRIAFAVLGGRRGRYRHFGFEKCDAMTYYALTPKTVSYLQPDTEGYSIREIKRDDTKLLNLLHIHMHKRPYYTVRPRKELFDILVSWQSTPYAYFKGDTLVGWAIHYRSKRQLSEFEYLNPSDVPAMLALSTARFGDISVAVPVYEKEKAALIDPYAENVTSVSNECFLVLDWLTTLDALFSLQKESRPLCDGKMTVEIEGYQRTVTLTVTVKNGIPAVYEGGTPELTLTLPEAELFFFRNIAPKRTAVSPEAASWLPLPLFIHECDNV